MNQISEANVVDMLRILWIHRLVALIDQSDLSLNGL